MPTRGFNPISSHAKTRPKGRVYAWLGRRDIALLLRLLVQQNSFAALLYFAHCAEPYRILQAKFGVLITIRTQEKIRPKGRIFSWLPYQRRILKNIKLSSSIFVRYLSSYRDLNILVLKVEIFKQLHYYLLFIIRVRSSLYKV